METLLRTILPLLCVLLASVAKGHACSAPPEYPGFRMVRSSKQTAWYKCSLGYNPFGGSPMIRCSRGEWTKLTLQCEKKSCGSAGELDNGHFKYEGELVLGDKAYAVCDDGYKVKGSAVIECGSDGWPTELPTCEEGIATCSAPKVANSGTKDLTHVFKVGEMVTVKCSQGLQMKGEGQLTCGSDGQWQPPPPECVRINTAKKVTCSAPKVANSGSMVFAREYKVGDTVTVRCSKGFQMRGTEQMTCGLDGQWQPPPPECVSVPTTAPAPTSNKKDGCGVPENIKGTNAALAPKFATEKSFASGASVYYVCDVGYFSQGSKYRVCSNGQWSPLKLKCQIKQCGSAGEILNGRYEYTGVEFGDTATAVCDEGHQLVGHATRHCLSQGWDGHPPVCEVLTCDEPPQVANAEVSSFAQAPYQYSAVITYRCLVGSAVGPTNIWCTKDGTWSIPQFQCKERSVMCSAPKVANSKTTVFAREYKVGDTVTVRCSQGFQMRGEEQMTCGWDGRWQPPPPECVSVPTAAPAPTSNKKGGCSVPKNIKGTNAALAPKYATEKSFASGATVYYVCDVGYVSRGKKYRVCTNGRWSPLRLRCQIKQCGSAGEILNGRYEYTGVEFGDTATAVCDEGHQLVGHATRHCLSQGWDGHPPVCEVLTCDEPPQVANAEVSGYGQAPYQYRAVVTYRCLVGSAVGPTNIWCTKDGTWSTPQFQCKAATCASPNIPRGLWVRPLNQYQYGDSIQVQCSSHHTLIGPRIITCNENGRWSPRVPVCIPDWELRRRG